MTPADLEKRIEAAARTLYCEDKRLGREAARIVIAAAFPELFADPPTHWLAPMDYTEKMSVAYNAMRDEFIKVLARKGDDESPS